jgi:hypothetical protein
VIGLGQLMIDELRLGLAQQRSLWGVRCSSVPIGSKEERESGSAAEPLLAVEVPFSKVAMTLSASEVVDPL